MALLEISDLRTYYTVRKGEVRAVDGVNFYAERGKTVGLVGESGCGKTTLAFGILQLLPRNARVVTGEIRFNGEIVYRATLTNELAFHLNRDGTPESIQAAIERRKRSLDLDRTTQAGGILWPLLQEDAYLIEDVEKLLGENGRNREDFKETLADLIDRHARSMNRGFTRRSIRRALEARMSALRWSEVSMIFQGAMSAFNPVYRVGDQIEEAIKVHMELTAEEREARVAELFELVGMRPERAKEYPHEFSGGMKQRAMIAMALACKPDLVIADEPTTALDVIMQDRILAEVRDLQRELNLSMIIITHDISVVAEVSDRIAIMYAGEIVEEGPVVNVFDRPAHPYAIGLLGAFPNVKGPKKMLEAIPGSPPDLVNPPSGCRFHPRCRFAQDICVRVAPPHIEVESGHLARCHFAKEIFRGDLA